MIKEEIESGEEGLKRFRELTEENPIEAYQLLIESEQIIPHLQLCELHIHYSNLKEYFGESAATGFIIKALGYVTNNVSSLANSSGELENLFNKEIEVVIK